MTEASRRSKAAKKRDHARAEALARERRAAERAQPVTASEPTRLTTAEKLEAHRLAGTKPPLVLLAEVARRRARSRA